MWLFGKKKKGALGFRVDKTAGQRQAYRVRISGLRAKIKGKNAVFSVLDLSPGGLALAGTPRYLREGVEVGLTLFHEGRAVASDLQSRVARRGDDFVGFIFLNLDRRQSDAIHALVLAEQKKMAEIKKREQGRR